jgi:hypothetical protein
LSSTSRSGGGEGLGERRLAFLGGGVGQAVLAGVGHDEFQARRQRAERGQAVAQVDRGHLAVDVHHAMLPVGRHQIGGGEEGFVAFFMCSIYDGR